MRAVLRWTSADLKSLPENGNRYEIIDSELYVSTVPRYEHQRACSEILRVLNAWSRETKLGEPFAGAGIIFADDDDVIPDVIWVSHKRRDLILRADGHFHGAPELVVEVLSFTGSNERRDREDKLQLYSRRGVEEYWIVNWMMQSVEIYRRKIRGLKLVSTLSANDSLTSPLLPGFSCKVGEFFEDYLTKDRQTVGRNGKQRQ